MSAPGLRAALLQRDLRSTAVQEHGIVGSQGRNLEATSTRVSSKPSLVPNTSKDGDCVTWELTLNLLFWGSPV